MASVAYRSGCKVAWETFDDEAEALAASEKAKVEARRKAGLGYDFGYCFPGEVRAKNDPEFGDVWVVTLP